MKPMRLFIIRHGETEWNFTGRVQGHAQTELNATGHRQAKYLAERLDGSFSAIYSSDLIRTIQTAIPLAKQTGLGIRTDPRWREIDVGEGQGLSGEEVRTQWPEFFRQREIDFVRARWPGGEDFADVIAKVEDALQDLIKAHPGEDLAIFTHGGSARAALCVACGGDDSVFQTVNMPNTALSIIEWDGERWHVPLIADTGHLPDDSV